MLLKIGNRGQVGTLDRWSYNIWIPPGLYVVLCRLRSPTEEGATWTAQEGNPAESARQSSKVPSSPGTFSRFWPWKVKPTKSLEALKPSEVGMCPGGDLRLSGSAACWDDHMCTIIVPTSCQQVGDMQSNIKQPNRITCSLGLTVC